jgi:hypothetical protein
MTCMRVMLHAAALGALLAAPVAQAQPAPAGKGVVVVQATRVPRAVARLIDGMLREKLQAAGSTPISADAVTSMQAMLKLPRRRRAEDWIKLGRSLIADRVLVASLNSTAGKIRTEVTLYTLTTEVALSRSATVAAAELLATTGRLAEQVLGSTPASAPASAPAPSAAAPASQPASAPSVVPPAAPVIAPSAAATPPPSRTPAPVAGTPPVADTPPVVRKRPRGPNPLRPTLTFGLHSYYLFSEARGGPMLELELGLMRNNYRGGMVFRSYFGDQNSYLVGGRFEGGPRWGRFRLSFGLDIGFIFTPDVGDNVDLVLFSARLVSGMFQWKHLALLINAFSLDLYMVPADQSPTQEVESLGGFTSGVSIAAYF